jgi:AcrR family transcriptional regulator
MPVGSRNAGDEEEPLTGRAGAKAMARARLVATAERLFADCGLEAVSLRQIAIDAGQRNNFAVQYHFGSRAGLVQAVFDSRMIEMEPIRARMLESAEQAGSIRDLHTLLRIVYLPQLELRDTGLRHSYAGFLAQYLLRHQSTRFGEFSGSTPPHLARTLELLREGTLHLSEAVAQRRLIACSLMFVHLMLQHVDAEWRNHSGEDLATGVVDTIDQIARCLSAPPPVVQEENVSSM